MSEATVTKDQQRRILHELKRLPGATGSADATGAGPHRAQELIIRLLLPAGVAPGFVRHALARLVAELETMKAADDPAEIIRGVALKALNDDEEAVGGEEEREEEEVDRLLASLENEAEQLEATVTAELREAVQSRTRIDALLDAAARHQAQTEEWLSRLP
jgi:hypothetical protein